MVSYMSGPLLGHVEAGVVAAAFGVRASVVSGGVLCVLGVLVCGALLPRFVRYDARAWKAAVANAAQDAVGDSPGGSPKGPDAEGAPSLAGGQRNPHRERRAEPFAGALGADRSAVELHQVVDDREPQAQAAVPARGGGVGLAEGVEDVGHEMRRDPLPRVADDDLGPAVVAPRPRRSTRPPSGVNFTALDSRFSRICWSRSESPRTGRSAVDHGVFELDPLVCAAGVIVPTAESTISARPSVRRSSRILPLTMRLMSSRSSMRCACARALRRIAASPWAAASGRVLRPWVRICAQPRMAFSGVRSSCDTVARKSSFSRLARSASARAARSSPASWQVGGALLHPRLELLVGLPQRLLGALRARGPRSPAPGSPRPARASCGTGRRRPRSSSAGSPG